MASGMLADDQSDGDAQSGDLGQREVDEDDSALHHVESEVDQQPRQQHDCHERPQP